MFAFTTRLALAGLAAALLASTACGGESPASVGQSSADLTTTTTNFTLTSVDGQTPPNLVCVSASGTLDVTGGTLTINGTNYTATFTGTNTVNGTTSPASYTETGKVTISGNTYTFKAPGAGTFTGTLSNGTLTISGYTYCGSQHTAVYTQQ